MKDRALSISGSEMICLRSQPTMKNPRTPTRIPPPAASRKSSAMSTTPTVAVVPIATMAILRATRAVASLSRDSPSRMLTRRRGRPMRRPIAVAATASGGAITAPMANAAGQWMPGIIVWINQPTATVVNATRPTDNNKMGLRLALKSMSEVLRAAE